MPQARPAHGGLPSAGPRRMWLLRLICDRSLLHRRWREKRPRRPGRPMWAAFKAVAMGCFIAVASSAIVVVTVHGGCCRSMVAFQDSVVQQASPRLWMRRNGARHLNRALRFAATRGDVGIDAALEVLSLKPGVDKKDIRKRYRQLVATEHPDKKPGDSNASKRFAEINAAYLELVSRFESLEEDGIEVQGSREEAENFAQQYGGYSEQAAEARWRAAEREAGIGSRRVSTENSQEVSIAYFVAIGAAMTIAATILYSAFVGAFCLTSDEWWCAQ